MKILFDQGTPVPLRKSLQGHTVRTAHELGWATLTNGELLSTAENSKFEIFITTDKSLQYQQNLKSRKISIIVLSATSWPRIRNVLENITAAVEQATESSFIEIEIP